MNRIVSMTFAALAMALIPHAAFAHIGIGVTSSFAAGFVHPLSGLDHITVMLAVGLWAALKSGRALWVWPATFVGMMLAGGALGMTHVPLPFVEPAILASVVALGLLVALAVDWPVWAGALVVGVFAVFHGHAHGTEVTETIGGFEYLAGFACATAMLHTLGIAFALAMGRVQAHTIVRIAGVACVLIGVGLWAELL